MPEASRTSAAARRGKTAGAALFTLLLGVPTVIWASQIVSQAWSSPAPSAAPGDCRAGLAALLQAVRQARTGAADEAAGERASLARFRQALEPTWSQRAALGAACRDDPPARQLLHEVELLRYAEERTVRQDSTDVARRRRRVRRLAAALQLDARVDLAMPGAGD